MEPEALVSDYLGRLERAAQPLPADRRGELIAEVHEHIESALAEAGSRDEVTARNVLERLPTHLNSCIDELLPHRWQPAT